MFAQRPGDLARLEADACILEGEHSFRSPFHLERRQRKLWFVFLKGNGWLQHSLGCGRVLGQEGVEQHDGQHKNCPQGQEQSKLKILQGAISDLIPQLAAWKLCWQGLY